MEPNPQQIKAPELIRGAELTIQDNQPGTVVAADPTQVRRPWRTTARTAFQVLVALCALFPVLVDQTGLRVEDFPWLAIPLAVAAAVARIMANPQVEVFLRTFLPFLSAAPKES